MIFVKALINVISHKHSLNIKNLRRRKILHRNIEKKTFKINLYLNHLRRKAVILQEATSENVHSKN